MKRSLAVLFALLCGTVVACGEADVVAARDDAALAAGDVFVTHRVFGEMDPQREVARCGGRPIVVADVAYWLSMYPVLTVEQAIEDLTDLCVVREAVDPDRFETWPDYRADAQLLARAVSWLRHTILMDETIAVDPAEVAAYVDAPENTTFFGRPELVNVSHAVVLVGENPEPAALEIARTAATAIAGQLRALEGPIDPADIARAVEPQRAAIEAAGMQISVEAQLRFPRVYSGDTTWGSLSAVVEPFAEAAFSTPVGGVFGPLETSYGWHAGVVEAIEPEDLAAPAERPVLVERNLLTAAQRTAFDTRLRVIFEAAEVLIDPAAVDILAGSSIDRIASGNRRQ